MLMLPDSEDDEGEEAEPAPAGQVSYNKQTMPGKSHRALDHIALTHTRSILLTFPCLQN